VYGFEARIRKGLAALGITSPPLQAVAKVASADKPLRQAVTRTYFIQAEQQEWVRTVPTPACAWPHAPAVLALYLLKTPMLPQTPVQAFCYSNYAVLKWKPLLVVAFSRP
jgi:hypothetical protein